MKKHSKNNKKKKSGKGNKGARKRKLKSKKPRKPRIEIVANNLERTGEIAWYYGFNQIKTPVITKEDVTKSRQFGETIWHSNELTEPNIEPTERVALLRTYIEENMPALPQPAMISYKKPMPGSFQRKNPSQTEFGLEIIGPSKSIAEIVTIKAAMEILKEEGYTETYVEINSAGDRESLQRFERELANYYRKNINSMPAVCRQAFKNDVFEIVKTTDERCLEIRDNAPQAMSTLSDFSRIHFKEILESLEILKIPYRVTNSLVGNIDFCPQTMFAIREGTLQKPDGELLAIGGRFNYLAKRIDMKKETPIVGISLSYKKRSTVAPKNGRSGSIKIIKPKFYFIQLGSEAKLKGLEVIDLLCSERIPIFHSLTKDKIFGQLSSAENMKLPYVLIMGQKEAHENSVLVRNTETRAQDAVLISNLPKYLKRLK